jgi:hypothetical protein
MAEAANFPLSPQQDSCIRNASTSEMGFAEPKDASHVAENAIAARVLELHDRLGGFIKPHRLPLSPQPDPNT